MEPVACVSCQRAQPNDWQPGDRCIHCGNAVRVDTRCAACTRITPAAKFCRHCAAELVPDAWYGAARMLVQAGVDRLSLGGRVRALDPAQLETFSSRFAQQRALVEQVVSLARYCESFLVTHGHADALEESLVSRLPLDEHTLARYEQRPSGPYDRPEQLELARTGSTFIETRSLATLALLRCDDVRDELVKDALGLLSSDLAIDAALALSRLALGLDAKPVPRWCQDVFAVAAAAAMRALPDSVDAALTRVLVLSTSRRDLRAALDTEGLTPLLREGLTQRDTLVRCACARLLSDEPSLGELADDPRVGELALRTLSSLRSPLLVERFRSQREEAARLHALKRLRTPLSIDAFDAVVESLDGASESYCDAALRVLVRAPFMTIEPGSRARLERWLDSTTLPVERTLELLRWAVERPDDVCPTYDDVASYTESAARALEPMPDTSATLRLFGVDKLVSVATKGRPAALICRWLRAEETVDEVLRQLLDLHARLHDDRVLTLLFAQWGAMDDEGRHAFADHLAHARRRGAGGGRGESFVAALWARFLDEPAERAALWRAGRSDREALVALRDDDPRAEALDGGDPAIRFTVYSALAPLEAPSLLRTLLEQHDTVPAVSALTPVIVERATAMLGAGEHRHALWLWTTWMSAVTNRFREEATREPWRAVALALGAADAEVQKTRMATLPSDPSDSLAGFDEQSITELQIVDEVIAREAERVEREVARELATQARAREHAERLESEARAQQAEALEAQQKLGQARAVLAERQQQAEALDLEVVLPEQPLRTLAEYAAVLRAFRTGGDVMAILNAAGLTPATWGACATAWGDLMSRRQELAMRFGQLLA
ncbi:MAG: hypothetical protein ABI445_08880 [Polyangia bacterium]